MAGTLFCGKAFTEKGGIGTRANPRFALPRDQRVALAVGSDVEVLR